MIEKSRKFVTKQTRVDTCTVLGVYVWIITIDYNYTITMQTAHWVKSFFINDQKEQYLSIFATSYSVNPSIIIDLTTDFTDNEYNFQ